MPYRSAHGRMVAAAVLLAFTIGAGLAVVWADLEQADMLEFVQEERRKDFEASPMTDEEIEAHDNRAATISLAWLLVYIGSAVAWLMWWHRMYANLPALGAHDLKSSPGGAVGIWFIPFINLVRPYEIAQEMWARTAPSPEPPPPPPARDTAPRRMRLARPESSPLIKVWWAAWLGWNIVAIISTKYESSALEALDAAVGEAAYHDAVDALIRATHFGTFVDALGIPAALLAIAVARALTARQEAAAIRGGATLSGAIGDATER